MSWSRGRLWALGCLLALYLLGMVLLSAVTLYEPRPPGPHLTQRLETGVGGVSVGRGRSAAAGLDGGALRPALRRAKLSWCSELQYLAPPRYPTALASFPGSGNTWLRYLLQQATGYYTGSVYKDYGLLKNGFPAESVSNGSVLVVKTHEWGPRARRQFAKAVLLVRAPGPAIQAEFNRQSGGHVGFASPDRFKRLKGKYWQQFVQDKLSAWRQTNLDWLYNFTGPTHVVFYEQLVSDVHGVLSGVLRFLGQPAEGPGVACAVARKEGIYRRRPRVLSFEPYSARMRRALDLEQARVYHAIRQAVGTTASQGDR